MSTYGGDSWVPEAQLRKRRVEELALEGIPLKEAKKLTNGKFICLVCRKKPVMDTAAMLIVHRSGAQHLSSSADWNEENFQLQQSIDKQTALSLLSDKKKSPSRKPFPGSAPLLIDTRKKVVSILSKKEKEVPEKFSVFMEKEGILRGDGLKPSSFSLSQGDRPFFNIAKDNHLEVNSLKLVHKTETNKAQRFLKEREECRESLPRPYVSKRERALQTSISNTIKEEKENPVDIILPVFPQNSRKNLFENVATQTSFQIEKVKSLQHQGGKGGKEGEGGRGSGWEGKGWVVPFQDGGGSDDFKVYLKTRRSGRGEKAGEERGRKKRKGECKEGEEGKSSSKTEQLDNCSFELRERRERELRLREAGWIRDGFGNWFRDANVEFDSDEETPCV